jgi:butyrate kinase
MYKVFAINPGSTSTKIALLEDDKVVFGRNVSHDAQNLAEFATIADQFPYREQTILDLLEEERVSLEGVDAWVCQGGGLFSVEGGVYDIDELILEHARTAANGVIHPANVGPRLCDQFRSEYGGRAFIVNPPDVDEMQELARMTGIKGVYRQLHLHALNLKETTRRHAETMGKKYEDCNFIACHIGGGISVSAHRRGRMVDGFDIVGGEGSMTPTRCGSIAVADLLRYAEGKDLKEMRELCTKSGGFVSHLGTSDSMEVTRRAASGDRYAEMLWNTMVYQIQKCIGSMAVVLHGDVDGIVLGGGMVHSEDLVGQITDTCSFIAPVTAYPGEFEMEAMGAAAARALAGEEKVKTYTGRPVWAAFDF